MVRGRCWGQRHKHRSIRRRSRRTRRSTVAGGYRRSWFAWIRVALALIDLDVRRLPKAILVAVVSVLLELLGRLAARLVVAWAGIGGVELFAFYFVLLPGGNGAGIMSSSRGSAAAFWPICHGGGMVVGAFAGLVLGAVSVSWAEDRAALRPFMIAGVLLTAGTATVGGWYSALPC
jgi:leader peptidase (prepilin peptidase) / N-methyltransferase